MPETTKVARTSEDVPNENLQKLRAVFPQFVKDGQVDFDALQAFFDGEKLNAGSEKYGLSWAGKADAFRAIRTSATGTVAPQPGQSKNWDTTKNIFIEGDNLEVLKLLQKHYRAQVKLIYIDPPYNTGKDFIYKDNFIESVSDYYERTGQSKDGVKMTANPESNGRYHSDWLTMMYPRLFLARNLLCEDGVLFVSIDDNEIANLRLIMDEIFGEENFVSTIVWKKKTNGNNVGQIPYVHDYILVYARSIDENPISGYERSKSAGYSNPDNDPRGPWTTMDLSANHEGPYFPITNLKTGQEYNPPPGRYWVFNEQDVLGRIKEGRIIFGKSGKVAPVQKVFWNERKDKKVKPETWWDHHGLNEDGTAELAALLGQPKLFDNPKPVELIRNIVEVATEARVNSLVLDFFAGSGTTAHAVMDLNAEDGGNRRWICVQLPEETDSESEAYKAGYKNIANISRERIRRAGEKILIDVMAADDVTQEKVDRLDTGFKALTLQQSNYRQWQTIIVDDGVQGLIKQLPEFIDSSLAPGYVEKSVVYEILTKEGFDLNSQVEHLELGQLEVWVVKDDDRRIAISFAGQLRREQIESLNFSEKDTFVCFDSALDDTTKVNISRNLILKVI